MARVASSRFAGGERALPSWPPYPPYGGEVMSPPRSGGDTGEGE